MESFDSRFLSHESDFIYNFGVNKGHILTISKVLRCYFLSSQAKVLYLGICSYAYGGKKDCYPSQASLRAELGGWSRATLNKYLDELRDCGLISTERSGFNSRLTYHIEELHKIPILTHSEMVHMIREEWGRDLEEIFFEALEDYKKSDLYQQISDSDDPIKFLSEVKRWFQTWLMKDEPVREQPRPVAANVKVIDYSGVQAVDELGPQKRKKKVAYDKDNPATWSLHAFLTYFADEYVRKVGSVYIPNQGADSKCMSRVYNLMNTDEGKVRLKQKIDAFLDLDFFGTKTITVFSSSWVQSVLDNYLTTGKLPSQTGKSNQFGIKADNNDIDLNTLFKS